MKIKLKPLDSDNANKHTANLYQHIYFTIGNLGSVSFSAESKIYELYIIIIMKMLLSL